MSRAPRVEMDRERLREMHHDALATLNHERLTLRELEECVERIQKYVRLLETRHDDEADLQLLRREAGLRGGDLLKHGDTNKPETGEGLASPDAG